MFSLFYTTCQIRVGLSRLFARTHLQSCQLVPGKSFIKDHLLQHASEWHLSRTQYCTFFWRMKHWGCGFDFFYKGNAGWAAQGDVLLFILYISVWRYPGVPGHRTTPQRGSGEREKNNMCELTCPRPPNNTKSFKTHTRSSTFSSF